MDSWRSLGRTLKKAAVACVALSLPVAATATPARAQGFDEIGGEERFVQRSNHTLWDYSREIKRFIVKFNDLTGQSEETNSSLLNEIAGTYGSSASKVREGQDGTWIVELEPAIPADDVLPFRADLESKAQINWADPDYYMVPFWRPNDPLYQYQWQFANGGYNRNPEKSINAEAAWELGYRGEGVKIAIVDSGITNHPDLNDKVLDGFDMVNDDYVARDGERSIYGQRDDNPADTGDYSGYGYCAPGAPEQLSSWHGTHVAGLAAASTDNGIGVAGAAPDANIVPVRVLGACGGYESDIADGMVWAAGGSVPNTPTNLNPARVINLSLGGPGKCSRYYQSSVDKARREGAVLLTAAGNDNIDIANIQPASCRGVFVIGSTGPEGEKSAFSNWGFEMDLAAPGGNSVYWNDRAAGILSTFNTGQRGPLLPDYGYIDGTSMATPLVSGVVAMMLHANPDLTNTRVEQILKNTAQEFGQRPDRNIGVGILDAYEAVCQAIRDRGGKDCDEDEVVPSTSTTTPTVSTATTTETATAVKTDVVTETATTVSTDQATTRVTETKTDSVTATETTSVISITSKTVTPKPTTEVVTQATTPKAKFEYPLVTVTENVGETVTSTTTKLETSRRTTTVDASPVTTKVTKTAFAPKATVTETVEETVAAKTPTSVVKATVTSTPPTVTVVPTPVITTVVSTLPQEVVTEVTTSTSSTTLPPKIKYESAPQPRDTQTVTVTAETPVVVLDPTTERVAPNHATTTKANLSTLSKPAATPVVTSTVDERVTKTETATSTAQVTLTTTNRRPAPTVTATTTTTVAPVTETVVVTAQAQPQPKLKQNGDSGVVANAAPSAESAPAESDPGAPEAGSSQSSEGKPWWLIAVTALVGLAGIIGGIIAANPNLQHMLPLPR